MSAAVAELEAHGKGDEAGAVRLHIRRGHFLEAAQEARQSLGSGWEGFLRHNLDADASGLRPDSLRLPAELWNLAHPLIITTNFDRLLRETCPEKARLNLIDIEGPAEQSDVMRGTATQPTLWHLHGRIDNLASVILTPDGFERLYGSPNAEAKYQTAKAVLQTLLRTHTFLFVGFSFDDPAIGTELRAFAEVMQGAGGSHYAILRQADADRVATLGLPIEPLVVSDFGQPVLDFLAELRGFVRTSAGTGGPSGQGERVPAVADFDPKNRASYIPFRPKGDGVIGRDADLQAVRDQLVSGRRTSIGQTAAFQGLGGLGKTQLAIEYATHYAAEYPSGVVWLTADQDISAQLIEVADRARWVSPQSEHRYKLDIALQRLRTFDGGLVVFDNVERLEDIEPYLPLPEASPHLLLTSRVEIHPFVPVPLDLLSDDQAYDLLLRESGRQPVGGDAESARGIAVRLGGLPLALELAGSYLARFGSVSFADYARLFEEGSVKVLELGRTSGFTKHDADLASSLAVHERALEEAPAFREVLDVLTWGASAPVSEHLLAAMLPHIDAVALTQALALGSTLRILQPVEGEKRYALHRLVAEVRRAQTDLDTTWANEMAGRVAAWFREQRNDFTRLADYEADFDQLEAWRAHVRSQAPILAAELLWLQAYPAYHRGQGAISNRHVAAALQELQSTSGDFELEGHIRHDLSTTLAMMGEHTEALELAEQALAIRYRELGEHHIDTAQSLESVGVAIAIMGRHAEALDLSERALAIRRKELGGQHPDTARSIDIVGGVLYGMGRHAEALDLSERALAIRRKELSGQHPDTARSLESVGASLHAMGRLTEALSLKQQALEVRRSVLGEQHPDMARSLGSIGETLHAMGRLTEALSLKQQALEVRRSVLGEQHTETALSLDSVGTTLHEMGRHAEALDLSERALAIRRKELGGQHPDTAQSLDSVGATLAMQGQMSRAVPMIRQALGVMTDVLGPTHTRTVGVLKHLVQMTRPGEGFPLYTEIRKRVSGMRPDDPMRETLRRLEREAKAKLPGAKSGGGRRQR